MSRSPSNGQRERDPKVEPTADRCVLVVAAGWWSIVGGVGTFNRLLCAALARAGVAVYCYVPCTATPEEVEDARQAGVWLVQSRPGPDETPEESLYHAPELPIGIVPDAVLGHDRWTGPIALDLASRYPGAITLPVMHVDPDQVERRQDDAGGHPSDRAEQRRASQYRLIRAAGRVLVVGPVLARAFGRSISAMTPMPTMIRIDPGFDGYDEPQRPGLATPFRVLYLGRLKHPMAKGVDIAARAIGHTIGALGLAEGDMEFVLRGATTPEEKDLESQINEWAGRHRPWTIVRSFTSDPEGVLADLREANLVVMPSRVDSLGFAALEAIGMATPVLVSGRSGAGILLRENLSKSLSDRVVIDVTNDEDNNVQQWSYAIAGVVRRPEVAAAEAWEIREVMARQCTWAGAADAVIRAIDEAGSN